jgi:nucleoprotein TPR
VQDLSTARESLVGAETSRKHLEDRVNDLSKHLQSAEEKLNVYERRPSASSSAMAVDDTMPREQQLEAEVASLRSSLKSAELDLASARGHVEQFKNISSANEAALASLSSTFDDFKSSSEAQIAQYQVRQTSSSPCQ